MRMIRIVASCPYFEIDATIRERATVNYLRSLRDHFVKSGKRIGIVDEKGKCHKSTPPDHKLTISTTLITKPNGSINSSSQPATSIEKSE